MIVPSYHFLLGPTTALGALGLLVLLCRWTFGGSKTIAPPRRHTGPRDYGLLTPAVTLQQRADAEALRQRIAGHGLRCTVARSNTGPGYVVLVFPADLDRARELSAAG